jgi:uncharacterized repeat protein (TIGR03806 family)
MKKYYLATILAVFTALTILYSCGSDDPSEEYVPLPVSPVVLDLDAVPYASLADYNFFEGDIKNLQPVYGVLPYDLNSSLFTDYAKKKRFVWMPAGQTANYVTDGQVFDFPVGTVLIKNFYYDNTTPSGTTVNIETRLMIKKATGWIFANYVWNNAQTQAVLNTNGGVQRVEWLENGVQKGLNYKIPTRYQCLECHAQNSIPSPIGIKPQNINKNFTYADGSMNQLAKWKSAGYLDSHPATSGILTTVDWTDASQPIGLRARSYVDINCAHCHTQGADCGYTPMDFAFSASHLPENMGICQEPVDFVTGTEQFITDGQDTSNSLMYFRMSTNEQSEMMPPLGRTMVHQEGLDLIEAYINSLDNQCP